nr:hypothetical protein BaRGS_025189 [Batillaria attramentaria]
MSGKSYISGATGSPDGQGYQYEEPERDVPVQDVPEKESAARDAYPIRGVPKKKPWKPKTPKYVDDYRSIAEARAAQAEAVAREKNFTLPSDPDSQHTKSHVYTHTPIASDLEYDPLYLKAKILEEGYRQLMKGDTSPVPATLPFKKQSTGTLVHKICRTPPTILFHNKKLRQVSSDDQIN